MQSKHSRYSLISFLLFANIVIDQTSKAIVRKNIKEFEVIPLFKSYFSLTKIENSGAFLSFGDSLPELLKFILLTIFPLIVLLVGVVFLFMKTYLSKRIIVALTFILGGGIGNLYDRIVYGSVTDFLHMDFVIFQTGIFNLADVSIMIGMGLIILDSFLVRKNKTNIVNVN